MMKDYFNAIPIASEHTDFLLKDFEKKELLKLKYYGDDGTAQVSSNYKVLENPVLKRVKRFINSKVKEYVKKIICIDNTLRMTQSWCAISKKGNRHPKHMHPNAFVSLVYYVDCDKNSGDLVFVKDKSSIQEGFNFNFKTTENNEYNSQAWRFETAPGYICIFPAHINHYSTAHNGDKDRIIIGANFFVDGMIGEVNNIDLMRINIR